VLINPGEQVSLSVKQYRKQATMTCLRSLLVLLLATAPSVYAITTRSAFVPAISNDSRQERNLVSTKMLLNPMVAHLVAGSVAGAIGCGFAHPLDTIKTKAQLSTKGAPRHESQIAQYQPYNSMVPPNGLMSMEVALPLRTDGPFQGTFELTYSVKQVVEKKPNMLQVAQTLYQQEGLEGFFGGVQTMMVGQALIRAVCFTTNAAVMDYLQRFGELDQSSILMLAAFSAGITSSFVVTSVERIKVLMQSNPGVYSGELQCIQAVLQKDGLGGLLTRGLGISLIREIPSVGLSFVLYASMMHADVATMLGSMAPLLFGAISGSVSCVPVYGIDCVKTRVQNTEGGNDEPNASRSPLEIAQDLYENRGISGFVDGLTPKILRCAVLSAVSFSVYETILSMLYTPVY